jgi:uncharacterized protein (TIGR02118 family)
MIKLVVVFCRKPGMSLEDFESHWAHAHAQLVAKLPGLQRYVQSQTLASGYRNRTPAFDGLAELWFDDTDALRVVARSPELAAVLADEAYFIDASTRREIVTDDVVIKDGAIPADGVKNIELVHRRPDLTPEAFHRHWEKVHGPIARNIPQILRYVQSHTRMSAYRDGREPSLDGVALTWFTGTAAMRESATMPDYEITRADEHNFVIEPLDFVITREREIAL